MTNISKSKAFLVEQPMSRQLLTVAYGVVGGLIFWWLNIPAGAMSGSLVAVAGIGSLFPHAIAPLGRKLRLIAMLVSGVSIGAAVTPETLRNVASYPISVTTMMICVFVMTTISTIMCMRFAGWDRATALLASVPGALAYILSIIPTTHANTPRVVAMQMVRVLFLMALVPVLVAESGLHITIGVLRPDDSWLVFAAECAVGAVAGFIMTKLRFAGGMLLGAMLVSALVHGFDIAHGRSPQIALICGQMLIGSWSGSRFAGFDWGLFLRQSPTILSSIAISVVVAGGFAWLVSYGLGLPFGATFLAFSPGGFEAMAVLALALGFDPFYVAAHHLARFFLLNFGMPVVVRFMLRADKR
jgi:membrane AbrB-like protein